MAWSLVKKLNNPKTYMKIIHLHLNHRLQLYLMYIKEEFHKLLTF